MTEPARGPWTIDLDPDDPDYAWIHSPEWGAFARVVVRVDGEPSPKGEANAHLIAASRSLLEALEMALQCIEYCRRAHKDAQAGDGVPVELFIKAAIAAAKGGKP